MRELIVDNFAGGGGASTGIELALGRSPDVAINHWGAALEVHALNHPDSKHLVEDVFKVHPRSVAAPGEVALAWFSPDCKHFSKAKGGKPVSKKIRGLAWVAVRWAVEVKPRVIILENVEEFITWGPLGKDNKPDPKRRGLTFKQFTGRLRNLGYAIEWRELVAADYGAPTTRKRLFLIARCDGRGIVWPEASHGKRAGRGGNGTRDLFEAERLPWRTAAECIDWSIPCPSIFERKRPLAEKTLRRIAMGLKRYVIEAKEPFIVPVTDRGSFNTEAQRRRGAEGGEGGEGAEEVGVVTPLMVRTAHGEETKAGKKRGRGSQGIEEPLPTLTRTQDAALVTPYLVPRYGEREGQEPRASSVEGPMPTIVPDGNQGTLIVPTLVGVGGRAGQSRPQGVHEPIATVTAKGDKALAVAFLNKHYGGPRGAVGQEAEKPLGTVTAVDHHSLTTAHLVRQFGASVGSAMEEPIGVITPGGMGKTLLTTARLEEAKNAEGGNAGGTPALPSDAIAPVIVGTGGPEYSAKPKGVDEPIGAQTTENHRAVAAAFLSKFYGTNVGSDVRGPLPTITGGGQHIAEVRAFLVTYYGQGVGQELRDPLRTVTTKDRLGLVTIHGVEYQIVDIGLRMLTPRELARAQGFPEGYRLPANKSLAVALIGNSVCPPVAEAIVRANAPELSVAREAVA